MELPTSLIMNSVKWNRHPSLNSPLVAKCPSCDANMAVAPVCTWSLTMHLYRGGPEPACDGNSFTLVICNTGWKFGSLAKMRCKAPRVTSRMCLVSDSSLDNGHDRDGSEGGVGRSVSSKF